MATNTRIELTTRSDYRENDSSNPNELYYYHKFARGGETTENKGSKFALIVLSVLQIVILLAAITCLGLIVAERFFINDKSTVSFVEHEQIKDLSSVQSDTIEKELDSLLYHSTLIDVSIQASIGEATFPARSCINLFQERSDLNSGRYWILNSDGRPVYVYCAKKPIPIRNTTSMMRVGYFNLDEEPNQDCPANFNDRPGSVRTCGRCIRGSGCNSIFFATEGVRYNRVCGRVIGYQFGTTDGFSQNNDINGPYIDGVSLTYGKRPQRKHIWTFVNGVQEDPQGVDSSQICPCALPNNNEDISPSFVGNDYFCESGFLRNFNRDGQGEYQFELSSDDPLWDGAGCVNEGNTCCTFNKPPWFCKDLPESTTEDIELRVCGNQSVGDEDTPITLYEIYVN